MTAPTAPKSTRVSRRYFGRTFAALGAATIAAWDRPVLAADAYSLRFGHPNPGAGVLGQTATRFAAALERRSNGQLKVEVFPNGQLAQQAETVDGIVNGVIDFTIISTAFLVPLVPRYQVFDLPFLFKDAAAAYRVFDGAVGNEVVADLDAKGIMGLGWGLGGFKQIQTTTKPIVAPDDMKGIRIRIQSGALYVATYQALGAIPITIDLAETFPALQQHTVDAVDLNLDLFTSGKYYTSVKHVAMSNHNLVVIPLLASKKKIGALPANLQTIIKEEGKAAIPAWRTATERQTADSVAVLKQNGVTFTDIQYAAFRKAMDPVYASFRSKPGGDLIDRIGRIANG